jgi:hypothetical protein
MASSSATCLFKKKYRAKNVVRLRSLCESTACGAVVDPRTAAHTSHCCADALFSSVHTLHIHGFAAALTFLRALPFAFFPFLPPLEMSAALSLLPSVFGRNLQYELVRGVNTREECH